jgi:molybdopterin-guanine dinucleotide biosynthesis protein A
MDLKGKPLIRYVVENLRPVVDEVIVVVGSEEKIPFYRQIMDDNTNVIADMYDEGSPLIGLISGLNKASGDYAVVAACDMPFINSAVVDLLFLLSYELNGTLLIKPNGWIEPLPAVYRVDTSLKKAIQQFEHGDLRIRKVLEGLHDVARVPVERLREIDPELHSFFDLDTPERVDEALKILQD